LDVWVETREMVGETPKLRGQIEDAETRTKVGVTSLGDIDAFVRERLDESGMSPEWENP